MIQWLKNAWVFNLAVNKQEVWGVGSRRENGIIVMDWPRVPSLLRALSFRD